jgi:exopolysaccharide production protein ExoZ
MSTSKELRTNVGTPIPRHLPALDGFRGIAILAVVVTHSLGSWTNLPAAIRVFIDRCGFGVDLFFLVSAFTLMHSVQLERDRTNRIDWKAFYTRRFFRIAPLFYSAAVFYRWNCCFIADLPWAPEGRTVWDYTAFVSLLHGFVPTAISIVPGGWSIGCEWIFYLLFGLIVARTASVKGMLVIFLMSMQLGYLLSLGIAAVLQRQGLLESVWTSWIHYCPFVRFPSFALGLWIYALVRDGKCSLSKWQLCGMAGVWFACDVYRTLPLTLMPLWLISNCGFACLLLAFAGTQNLPRVAVPLVWLGKLSFSIYIVHFYVLSRTYGIRLSLESWAPVGGAALYLLLVIAMSVAIAFVTWRLIEQPGIAIGRKIVAAIGRR